jgi:hypothetical protein
MFKINSNAFDTPVSEYDHTELIRAVARKVVARRMTVPAIMFFETTKPLSRLISQALIVFSPLAVLFFSYKDIDAFCDMLQDHANVEKLNAEIERCEEEYLEQLRQKKQHPHIRQSTPEP